MFNSAKSFNQSLDNWDVSKVTNMEGMFNSAKSFNQFLDNWDVSRVINTYGMFFNAHWGMKNKYGINGFIKIDSDKKQKFQYLHNLFVLAISDGEICESELKMINELREKMSVSESEFKDLVSSIMDGSYAKKNPEILVPISEDESWEHLQDMALLAALDYEIDEKEIEVFKQISVSMGYDSNNNLTKGLETLKEKFKKDLDKENKTKIIDSGENNRFLSSWSKQELRGIHNLFRGVIFEAYPMTDNKHKSRLGAMIGFFQMAFCSNQDTYSFVDNKAYQNFVKEIQLDKILPSKDGINSLVDLNKRKKNELLFMVTILITQSGVGWDEVFETKEFNLIRKMLAIEFNENSYNEMYEIYCEDDDKRLDSL
ncbi:BspA family leucine-rich repeat surface protein [uncultured Polaribacter sp.]|uniref:BspA family leucine-rich repeat surface protein n=1 Tax=uncultured Polaribacter sp. TaxID=174711 RepID=UPI00261F90EC|nr:BspA family leucine-rich repeat surface protein [uncultured Polaribacter sp.]